MHTDVLMIKLRYGQLTPDPRLEGYEPQRDPWSFPTYDEQKTFLARRHSPSSILGK